MKTAVFKNRLKYFNIIFICSLVLSACSSDEETNTSFFSYASDTFEVSFRTEGTIPAPAIEWSGEAGTFAMETEISGLSINETTGELTWERQLDIGEHLVQITAQNEQQVLQTNFVINSVLRNALWSGGHNNDPESDVINPDRFFTFFSNGTLEVELFGSPDSKGVGVWEIDGNQIELHFCTYCEGMDPFSIPTYDEHSFYQGTLVNEELTAFISGQRFVVRFDPDSTSLRGNFYVEWD